MEAGLRWGSTRSAGLEVPCSPVSHKSYFTVGADTLEAGGVAGIPAMAGLRPSALHFIPLKLVIVGGVSVEAGLVGLVGVVWPHFWLFSLLALELTPVGALTFNFPLLGWYCPTHGTGACRSIWLG